MYKFKRILLSIHILLLFLAYPLFAGGQNEINENDHWYIPNTNSSNPYFYYDLSENTLASEILQVGSTLQKQQLQLTISSPDNFQFVHTDNITQTYPYTLQLNTTKATRTFQFSWSWGEFSYVFSYGSWQQSETNAIPQISAANNSYTFPTAKIATATRLGTTYSGQTIEFINASLKINIAPASASQNLEPGIYKTRILVELSAPYYDSNSPAINESFTIELQAKYRSNINSGSGGFTDFNLSIEPTANTYSFDLKNNSALTPVANIRFTYTQISDNQVNYGNDPLVIGVSPSGTSWNDLTGTYKFKRIGSEYQEENQYNSITHSTHLVSGSGTSAETSLAGNRNQISVPHTVVNQSISSGDQYRNVFEFNGTASIQITGTNQSDLLSGRYYTNLYFYIIKN